VCCSALYCIAVQDTALHCIALHCSVLQCIAAHCSVLQCVAVYCSVLQCVAVRASMSKCVTRVDASHGAVREAAAHVRQRTCQATVACLCRPLVHLPHT